MKLAASILAVALMTVPALADSPCNYSPPAGMKEPNVPFSVKVMPPDHMARDCNLAADSGRLLVGCTINLSGEYFVVLSSALSAPERACALKYEKAHLPPNNWYDQAMESHHHRIVAVD
jgi:hypothetical protein